MLLFGASANSRNGQTSAVIQGMSVDSVRVSLKYNGPDVDDGTMPLKDVVEALQGFAGAYDKIAR